MILLVNNFQGALTHCLGMTWGWGNQSYKGTVQSEQKQNDKPDFSKDSVPNSNSTWQSFPISNFWVTIPSLMRLKGGFFETETSLKTRVSVFWVRVSLSLIQVLQASRESMACIFLILKNSRVFLEISNIPQNSQKICCKKPSKPQGFGRSTWFTFRKSVKRPWCAQKTPQYIKGR